MHQKKQKMSDIETVVPTQKAETKAPKAMKSATITKKVRGKSRARS